MSGDLPCPLCGSTDSSAHTAALDLGLRSCMNCSMVYVDSGDATKTIEEDAEKEFFGEGYLRKRDAYTDWFHRRKARRRLASLRQFANRGRLLEIGVGGGELLAEARREGYSVMGLDLSEPLTRNVCERFGIDVRCCALDAFVPSELFDVIVMSHVIEHVVDPKTMLKRVRQLLKPDGVLYVATPNVACWEARFDGWASYEPYHLVYFSPATITRLLEQTGFTVAALKSDEPLSAWLNTAVRGLLGRTYSNARMAVQEDTTGARRPMYLLAVSVLTAARILTGLALTPVRLLQQVSLRGDELICVAHPS